MEIPVFDGEIDAYWWVLCTEKYFKQWLTPETVKMMVAGLAMKGSALTWWLRWYPHHPWVTWDAFTTVFLWEFKLEWRFILPLPDDEGEKPNLKLDEEVEPTYESINSYEGDYFPRHSVADAVPEVVGNERIWDPEFNLKQQPVPSPCEVSTHYKQLRQLGIVISGELPSTEDEPPLIKIEEEPADNVRVLLKPADRFSLDSKPVSVDVTGDVFVEGGGNEDRDSDNDDEYLDEDEKPDETSNLDTVNTETLMQTDVVNEKSLCDSDVIEEKDALSRAYVQEVMDSAVNVFERMPERNLVSWNSIMSHGEAELGMLLHGLASKLGLVGESKEMKFKKIDDDGCGLVATTLHDSIIHFMYIFQPPKISDTNDKLVGKPHFKDGGFRNEVDFVIPPKPPEHIIIPISSPFWPSFSKQVIQLCRLKEEGEVGIAVVTRSDGKLALGRLKALCEQLKELNLQGYEIILVTSGAVGLGKQRLRYRRLANSSFSDLQKPQGDLDGKACAAVRQSSLMTLYDTMFSQLDVTSSQLLVNDGFFRDAGFRKQLSETVTSLLECRVIPIFNENDAVSTRKAPYEDSSGIFWDNDSLAGLLALELKADLLVLLSDVEGLYNGPPNDPNSKLIHTYIKEKHQKEVTFGDKSRLGRGGMTAKVAAAVSAANAGIPVIIISGYATYNIIRVLQGEKIGTVFHKDAHLWKSLKEETAHEMAVAARNSSRRLQALKSGEKREILLAVADALEKNQKLIRLENDADIADALEAGYDKSLISRLTLKPKKITNLAKSVRVLADMKEPIGQILKRTELADDLVLEKTSCPLSVLLIIFESRPDALVQIAALAIRSGNGLLLKGGKEARRSNAILHKIITSVMPDRVGSKLIGLVTSRDEIPYLLKLDDVIDLVVPRGSNKLVSQIKESTRILVLGHADGICHIYVDKSANIDMAKHIVRDAKTDYPAACNALETLLVHKDLSSNGGLNELILELQRGGVELHGGPKASDRRWK